MRYLFRLLIAAIICLLAVIIALIKSSVLLTWDLTIPTGMNLFTKDFWKMRVEHGDVLFSKKYISYKSYEMIDEMIDSSTIERSTAIAVVYFKSPFHWALEIDSI